MTDTHCEVDPMLGQIYLPGVRVPAGIYRLVGTNRNVLLEEDGYLPASLDGRVACYESIRHTWQQLQHKCRQALEPSTS